MKLKKELKEIIKDKKAQSNAYMLIVVAIIAAILIFVVKPMFNNSVKTSVKKANLPSENVNNSN